MARDRRPPASLAYRVQSIRGSRTARVSCCSPGPRSKTVTRASAEKPLMAENVFKNVQALKGIPADEFMGTMSAFSAALGESCETCHDGSGGWATYALDTIPRKRTARRMVAMMAAINQANFGG